MVFSGKTLLCTLLVPLAASAQQQNAGSFSFLPSSASSSFPQCGLSCPVLQSAQSACVPPQAGVSNDQTYISCFCQSAYLTGLKSSGAVCSSCTNPADQQLLVSWYDGYCAGGYTSTLAPTSTSTSSSNTNTATAPAATTTTAAATSTASTSKAKGPPSWFSTHYGWVIMLIVLAVAFTTLGILGTWWKKRHDAKQPGLYHGDDRRNASDITASGGRGDDSPAAPGFFSGSLRNLAKANANSSTANSSNNTVTLGSKSAAAAVAPAPTPPPPPPPPPPTTTLTKSRRQPNMSMVRSSVLSNASNSDSNPNSNINNNNNNNNNTTTNTTTTTTTTTNNNNNNNNTTTTTTNDQLWGPQQATAHPHNLDITPADGARNNMAAAAAAAALDRTAASSPVSSVPGRTPTPNRLSKARPEDPVSPID